MIANLASAQEDAPVEAAPNEATAEATPAAEAAPATEGQPSQTTDVAEPDAQPAPPAAVTYDEASTEEPKKKGSLKDLKLALGMRAGYALPFGDFADGLTLDGGVSGGVPVGIDAAVRLKNYELGLYAGIMVGFAGDKLEQDCADCSVFGYRFGAQANYHMLPDSFVDPWIGLGVGIEKLRFSETRTVQAVTTSGALVNVDIERSTDYTALPELTVQAGVDLGGDGPIRIGPFASFSISQFSEYETKLKCRDFRCAETDLVSSSGDIANTANHYWLQLGLRGTYLLF